MNFKLFSSQCFTHAVFLCLQWFIVIGSDYYWACLGFGCLVWHIPGQVAQLTRYNSLQCLGFMELLLKVSLCFRTEYEYHVFMNSLDVFQWMSWCKRWVDRACLGFKVPWTAYLVMRKVLIKEVLFLVLFNNNYNMIVFFNTAPLKKKTKKNNKFLQSNGRCKTNSVWNKKNV